MKKILFVSVLIFCLLASTQTAYAYFEQESIRVLDQDGELYQITENTNQSNKTLIPTGAILGVNDTYTLTYTYQVYVEKGVDLSSEVLNIKWGEHLLTDIDAENVYRFDVSVDHIKDVQISQGLFTENTTGELVEITVNITMNDVENIHDLMSNYGDVLTFDYVLTVSKS